MKKYLVTKSYLVRQTHEVLADENDSLDDVVRYSEVYFPTNYEELDLHIEVDELPYDENAVRAANIAWLDKIANNTRQALPSR